MRGPAGAELAGAVAGAIEAGVNARRVREVENSQWTWLESELFDERYALAVDVLASTAARPTHVVYMLAGGGGNFRSTFFSPRERNLAHFMRMQGALVVGISPREDSVPPGLHDYSFMADWGMAKHREDIRCVVTKAQAAAGLPYEVLGHSYGAAYALDYASHHSRELRRVIALDIYSVSPDATPGAKEAEQTYAAHVERMQQGVFHDRDYGGLKDGVAAASADPDAETNFTRAALGQPGNFSTRGVLDFSLIFTALLPGFHTAITHLPGDWPLAQSYMAGSYQFAEDPRNDVATFTHTNLDTLREAAAHIGGGILPVALERDYWAVNAGNRAYEIAWAAIERPVVWINAGLGYRDHTHAAELIRKAGNAEVSVHVVPDYGHADLVWGENAHADVWKLLAP